MGFDFIVIAPSYCLIVASPLYLDVGYLLWWLPVSCCRWLFSSCDSAVLTRGSENTSFYSTNLNQSDPCSICISTMYTYTNWHFYKYNLINFIQIINGIKTSIHRIKFLNTSFFENTIIHFCTYFNGSELSKLLWDQLRQLTSNFFLCSFFPWILLFHWSLYIMEQSMS